MERPDPSSSSWTTPSLSRAGSASGAFAYQTRLLERGNSRSGTLSRAGSLNNAALSQDGSAAQSNPTATRRWAPTHRVGGSLEAVRGKWEERVRAEAAAADVATHGVSREGSSGSEGSSHIRPLGRANSISRYRTQDDLPLSTLSQEPEEPKTPTLLKRHTMPAPIVASPLSPNTTGITVVDDSSPSSSPSTPNRIHLPTSTYIPLASASAARDPALGSTRLFDRDAGPSTPTSPYRSLRSSTLDNMAAGTPSSSNLADPSPVRHSSTSAQAPVASSPSVRGPASSYSSSPTRRLSTDKSDHLLSGASNGSSLPDKLASYGIQPPDNDKSLVSSSVMSPTHYRSSYMQRKKTSTYGDNLSVGRKLGRHLPRIASGDGDEHWEDKQTTDEPTPPPPPPSEGPSAPTRLERRYARAARILGEVPTTPERSRPPGQPPGLDDVAGIPGRLRLSRNKAPAAATPLPSGKMRWGLWADTQRHLLQAYEYLCHVGEAQQWIEGCLGEELGFGVVEMDDGLRNGVVLAKLVRVFQGEGVVRRIYDAPKLDFRHSDNINIFFNFVRHVGLPESFIFELTDLYDKKNIPKVIYCIHALSHLLARRGLAERIGNLLGHLKFSDDQLERTQKGLTAAGVAMPNFGNVGRELAKDLNEEPEPEIETEEERRDRLLMECEDSILALQSLSRAFLVRKSQATQRARLRIAERYIPRLQGLCRGTMVRSFLAQHRKQQRNLNPWATAIQAAARGVLLRTAWRVKLRRIHSVRSLVVKVQAQARGVIQRRRYAILKAALRRSIGSVVTIQSIARARIARKSHREVAKTFARPVVAMAVTALQAHARGVLTRRKDAQLLKRLASTSPYVTRLQAHARGVLMRRSMRYQLAKIDDVADIAVRIQSAARTYLARKRLLGLIRGLRKATPMIMGLQSIARARLAQRHHHAMAKAFAEVKVVKSVGGFQALARAALRRNQHREQNKQLEFVQPDVLGFQSAARGFLVRREYYAWRNYLLASQPQATMLQALLRGVLQRTKFRSKMQYLRANLDKVVKIQSLYRAKETREQYRQLTLGTNVNVGTIKNFVHLLDDSESDFQEELQVERLRKKVVESIRECQALENDVNELDVKIALVVQHVKSSEEFIKARRRHGADSAAAHAARASLLAAHGDPFAGPSTLDHEARRKLEAYQQLFYLLQTHGEYLSRLFTDMSRDEVSEKDRKFTERVVMTLFGYAQDRREDYLLLKLFQTAVQEEVSAASDIDAIIHGHPMYINVAAQYVRPKQIPYVREMLQPDIRAVVSEDDIDLEVDPTVIYRTMMELEEIRSGKPNPQPKDLPFHQVLQHKTVRPEYIRHLQMLQHYTQNIVTAVTQSTKQMPYSMRYLARETIAALKAKFPDAPEEAYARCVGRLVFYRYINPAVLTPETFDIVSTTVDVASRKNLRQISTVLAQITSGTPFGDDAPNYVPINDYVSQAIKQMTTWFNEVADVPDAETEYNAHEFLDATVQPRPIYISPNEVYAMHALLAQRVEFLAPARNDPLRIILTELGGVPNLGSEELKDARDLAITLELTNRFAHVKDPQADEKTLWVQGKRGVLAILRVQPAKDLLESLMQPVTDEHEETWDEIVEHEMIADHKQRNRRQPSATAYESAYRLEDIRALAFREVKAHAIYHLLELEKLGKITRNDGFQGILNAIAGDVRSKHRRRLQRQQEMDSMNDAMKHLAERKKQYQEQINSYHDFVEESMKTMQRGKGKKRFVMPFTKQYFHMRALQKTGSAPQFGSFKYSAMSLYEKGVLLAIDKYSPRQFNQIDVIISSNEVGVFTMELYNHALGVTNRMAGGDLKMQDLLQAQFENKSALSVFNGMAKLNLNELLNQITKKFYV